MKGYHYIIANLVSLPLVQPDPNAANAWLIKILVKGVLLDQVSNSSFTVRSLQAGGASSYIQINSVGRAGSRC